MKAKLDFLFLGILAVSLVASLIFVLTTDYLFTAYNYLAVTALVFAITLRITKPRVGRYATGILLLLGTCNLLNFYLYRVSFGVMGLTLFDPYMLPLLIMYFTINYKSISNITNRVFYGSDKDIMQDFQKKVDFYREKFINCEADELEEKLKNLNDYPPEAQEALITIKDKIQAS